MRVNELKKVSSDQLLVNSLHETKIRTLLGKCSKKLSSQNLIYIKRVLLNLCTLDQTTEKIKHHRL